jgi:hypothetical protein
LMSHSRYNNPVLRLLIAGYGWGGPSLGIALDESKEDEKNTQIINEIKLKVDRDVIDSYGEDFPLTISYLSEQGFIIDNGMDCSC